MIGRTIRRRLWIAGFPAALFLLLIPEGVHAEKPQGPLSIALSSGPAESGGSIELVFTVISRRDAPRMKVILEIPDGLTVVEGQTDWEGPVTAGEPVVLKIQVGPEGAGREVVGRATVFYPGGAEGGETAWTQSGSLVLQSGPVEAPAPRFRSGQRGSTIQEIPAR